MVGISYVMAPSDILKDVKFSEYKMLIIKSELVVSCHGIRLKTFVCYLLKRARCH